MAGKGRKTAAAEPVTTPKRKRNVKEEKKIPVVGKKDAAVKKVTLEMVKKRGRPAKEEKKEDKASVKKTNEAKNVDQKPSTSKVVGKAKKETPKKKTWKEVKTPLNKKTAIAVVTEKSSKVVKKVTKAEPSKKKDTTPVPIKKTKKDKSNTKVVKIVKKESPLKKKKVETPSKVVKKASTSITPKKNVKEVKKEENEPSTSRATKTAKKSIKKSDALSPTSLTASEKKLLEMIEAEEMKGEELARNLKERGDKVKVMEEEEKEARKEKADAVNAEAEMITRLRKMEERLETNKNMMRIFREKDGAQKELIEVLDRRLIQLNSIMEQRDIQSAHRGREALKQRIENRHLRRFLSAIRSYISHLSDGRQSPFIDRLLEMADEHYSPLEEHRRIRQMFQAAGLAPRRMFAVDLTHL